MSSSIIPQDIELFSKTAKRKIAIGFKSVYDISKPNSCFKAKIFQLRDITIPHKHVIINFDMEGRIINIELGREETGNEVKILERSFDREFYVYLKNCENLKSDHNYVYYYYDYYHENVVKEIKIS